MSVRRCLRAGLSLGGAVAVRTALDAPERVGVLAAPATLLNVLLGAGTPTRADLAAWPRLVPEFFLLLLIPGIGGGRPEQR